MERLREMVEEWPCTINNLPNHKDGCFRCLVRELLPLLAEEQQAMIAAAYERAAQKMLTLNDEFWSAVGQDIFIKTHGVAGFSKFIDQLHLVWLTRFF